MNFNLYHQTMWTICALVWFLLGFKGNMPKVREKSVFLFLRIFVVAGAAFLIFTSPAKAEIFFLQVAGAIFVTSGLVFAIWARMTLGKYWSGFIDPSSNSRLVTKGPYRYVRHPIYVGLLIALLGTAIQMNQGEFWVAYIGVTVTYIVKLKFEEKKLLVAFGDEYRKYMQNTWI